MAATKPHVIDVLRAGVEAWLATHQPTPEQARFLRDLNRCRTAALGGHLYVCQECGAKVPVYNPCGNRHCPNCQALDQARWIEARQEVLLPVGHHHVVFTLPAQLRWLALHHPRQMYGLLFDASADTLTTLAEEVLDARLGVTAVLHTWRRDLGYHPHLHCIVTGGGLSIDASHWVDRQGFLFPVRRMKALFRARVLVHLHKLRKRGALPMDEREWRSLLHSLPSKRKWVVYIEQPFGRSTHVLRYLGRYTHRVAISDARIVATENNLVHFITKDGKVAQLPFDQFVGRFLRHILPAGFRKIRHFGLYAPGNSRQRLDRARQLIGRGDIDEPVAEAQPEHETWDALLERLTGDDKLRCPQCGAKGLLCYVLQPVPSTDPPRRPP